MPHSPRNNLNRLLAISVALGVAGCTGDNSAGNNAAVEAPAPAPEPDDDTPLAELPLDRERLLVLLLGAASDAIVGADDREVQQSLNGKRFDLRMRFGCPDMPPIPGRSWSFDESSGALRVIVKPDIGEEAEKPPSPDAGGDPAALPRAGFQIPGPNILSVGCPTSDYAAVPGFTNLRFALVQTTDEGTPRAQQLLDSYEIVKKIAPEAVPTQGLDLILRGRLESGADGRVIACTPRGGIAECLANVTLEKVAIENPTSATLIAEWGAN